MRKTTIFLLAMILGIASLTSCLDGKNVQSGYALGVYDADGGYFSQSLFHSTVGPLYAPSMNTYMQSGESFLVYYNCDFDAPENSSAMLQTNNYYTVTISNYSKLPQTTAMSYMSDTSTVMDNEIPLLSGYYNNNGALVNTTSDSYLFLPHTLPQASDVELDWSMCYGNYSGQPTVVGAERFYDLYIRATKTTTKLSKSQNEFQVCYRIGSFLRDAAYNERNQEYFNAETSKFNVRIFWVSSVSNGKLAWSSAVQSMFVASFLDEEGY
ncbi:MAG: hypothetical protein LBD53_11550 [Tannerella sp.]|jgi:hypothetical protein|nr:hypothetical protein [Tannerella sp.]